MIITIITFIIMMIIITGRCHPKNWEAVDILISALLDDDSDEDDDFGDDLDDNGCKPK